MITTLDNRSEEVTPNFMVKTTESTRVCVTIRRKNIKIVHEATSSRQYISTLAPLNRKAPYVA